MRRIFPVLVLLVIAASLSLVATRRIWTEAGLEGACKEKTQAHFLANGHTPVDWMPVMHSSIGGGLGSIFGTWRVGERHYVVMCSARLGDPIAGIGYEIADPAGRSTETHSIEK